MTTDPFPEIERYVNSNLDRYAKSAPAPVELPAEWGPTAPAVDIFLANSYRREQVLRPGAFDRAIRLLRAMKRLGCQAAVISAHSNVFNGSDQARYTAYYRDLVDACRAEGLAPHLETACAFNEKPPADLSEHFRQRRHALEVILGEVRPDAVSCADEPDTEYKLGRWPALKTPTGYVDFLGRLIDGLTGGAIPVGAGTGSWLPLTWTDAILRLPVAFYTLHLYPTGRRCLQRADEIAARARAKGLRVSIGECWAFKALPWEELAGNPTTILARDAFARWDEIDTKYLAWVIGFARRVGASIVCPFWIGQRALAALPDFPEYRRLDYARAMDLLGTMASAALAEGRLSPLGESYRDLIGTGGPA